MPAAVVNHGCTAVAARYLPVCRQAAAHLEVCAVGKGIVRRKSRHTHTCGTAVPGVATAVHLPAVAAASRQSVDGIAPFPAAYLAVALSHRQCGAAAGRRIQRHAVAVQRLVPFQRRRRGSLARKRHTAQQAAPHTQSVDIQGGIPHGLEYQVAAVPVIVLETDSEGVPARTCTDLQRRDGHKSLRLLGIVCRKHLQLCPAAAVHHHTQHQLVDVHQRAVAQRYLRHHGITAATKPQGAVPAVSGRRLHTAAVHPHPSRRQLAALEILAVNQPVVSPAERCAVDTLRIARQRLAGTQRRQRQRVSRRGIQTRDTVGARHVVESQCTAAANGLHPQVRRAVADTRPVQRQFVARTVTHTQPLHPAALQRHLVDIHLPGHMTVLHLLAHHESRTVAVTRIGSEIYLISNPDIGSRNGQRRHRREPKMALRT